VLYLRPIRAHFSLFWFWNQRRSTANALTLDRADTSASANWTDSSRGELFKAVTHSRDRHTPKSTAPWRKTRHDYSLVNASCLR
jgi:hypothetical protein